MRSDCEHCVHGQHALQIVAVSNQQTWLHVSFRTSTGRSRTLDGAGGNTTLEAIMPLRLAFSAVTGVTETPGELQAMGTVP